MNIHHLKQFGAYVLLGVFTLTSTAFVLSATGLVPNLAAYLAAVATAAPTATLIVSANTCPLQTTGDVTLSARLDPAPASSSYDTAQIEFFDGATNTAINGKLVSASTLTSAHEDFPPSDINGKNIYVVVKLYKSSKLVSTETSKPKLIGCSPSASAFQLSVDSSEDPHFLIGSSQYESFDTHSSTAFPTGTTFKVFAYTDATKNNPIQISPAVSGSKESRTTSSSNYLAYVNVSDLTSVSSTNPVYVYVKMVTPSNSKGTNSNTVTIIPISQLNPTLTFSPSLASLKGKAPGKVTVTIHTAFDSYITQYPYLQLSYSFNLGSGTGQITFGSQSYPSNSITLDMTHYASNDVYAQVNLKDTDTGLQTSASTDSYLLAGTGTKVPTVPGTAAKISFPVGGV